MIFCRRWALWGHPYQRKFWGKGGLNRDNFRGGGGWPLKSLFLGLRVRLMSKLSVSLLLINISKEKLFSSAIFYLSLAECIFHGLHNSLYNNCCRLMNKMMAVPGGGRLWQAPHEWKFQEWGVIFHFQSITMTPCMSSWCMVAFLGSNIKTSNRL